jgi:dihydrofolate reductase
MAKLIFALNQSLDGYVDHQNFLPDPALFRHFIEDVRSLTGMVYGRRMYEVMRYWDEDHAEWSAKVAGPELARSLTELGLIDEYRLYFHPVVVGHGKPFFAGPRPPLRLVASDRLGKDTIRLTYVPA